MTRRCYTLLQVLDLLQMNRRTFDRLRKQHALPFLEEIRPRLGRHPRFRAEPVDKYLAGHWGTPSSFRRHV